MTMHPTDAPDDHTLATPPPPSEAMVEALGEIVGPDHVLTDAADRLAYNGDCSPRGIILTRGRLLEPHQPTAVVRPADEGEVRELVDWARRIGTPLIPFGDGSGVCRGAVANGEAVIVDLKRLDRLVEVDPEGGYVRVQPGMNGYLFEREMRRRELTVGHYPSSLYCSSVGGWVAARGAGQYSSRYGKIEDIVQSLRVVTGRGEVVQTAGAGAGTANGEVPEVGPNATQLFTGSEGTLGLITEVTLAVEPDPDHHFYRGFQFSEMADALTAIRRVIQAGLRPAVVRLYDPFDTLIKSGGSDTPTAGGREGFVGRLRQVIERVVPESVLTGLRRQIDQAQGVAFGHLLGQAGLVNSLVDAVASDCLLVMGFESHSSTVEEEADWAFDILRRYGVDMGVGPGEHWRRNRFSVSYKQSPLFDTGAFVDTMEVSTTWENLEPLYHRVRRALQPHVAVLAHFSHVYPEGSSIYFTFAGWAEDTERTLELYETVWRKGLDAVAAAGGSVTHHHGVGDQKSRWTAEDHVGGRGAFEALKAAFDPDGIMNPGKVYE